jgi:hypothetical protein
MGWRWRNKQSKLLKELYRRLIPDFAIRDGKRNRLNDAYIGNQYFKVAKKCHVEINIQTRHFT